MTTELLDSTVPVSDQELSSVSASSAMKLFQNPLFKVRVIMRCSNPWFVAKDVATCIEHSDTSAMCKLCRDKDVAIVNGKEYSNDLLEYSKGFSDDSSENPKKGGNPNITVISEAGLYRIFAKCNLPKCEPFELWVFDEVLPSIRKTGSYGAPPISRKDQLFLAIIHSESEEERADALKELAEINKQEVKALTAERDEAIRTKAQIGSSREATAMATASAKSKECEKLREQIGDSKTYKAAKSIPWLSEYFDTRNRGLYNSLAAQLKKIEASMPPEFAHIKIDDSQYGEIKAYHVAVIEKFHEIVRETIPVDEEFMKNYRKDVSPKSKNA